jgi:hypothetical protein
MNDKIKRLAKEAGYYLYDLTETHECKTVETDSKDEWITLEKFAELIVRECAKVADIADDHKCEWIGGNILTHFGVEDGAV